MNERTKITVKKPISIWVWRLSDSLLLPEKMRLFRILIFLWNAKPQQTRKYSRVNNSIFTTSSFQRPIYIFHTYITMMIFCFAVFLSDPLFAHPRDRPVVAHNAIGLERSGWRSAFRYRNIPFSYCHFSLILCIRHALHSAPVEALWFIQL